MAQTLSSIAKSRSVELRAARTVGSLGQGAPGLSSSWWAPPDKHSKAGVANGREVALGTKKPVRASVSPGEQRTGDGSPGELDPS